MEKQPKDSDIPSLPRLETLRVPLGEPIPLKEYRLAQYETGQNAKAVALVVLSRPDYDPPKGHILFVEDQQKFLDLACDILSALDPVTNEQILVRIRKLLEGWG